MRIVLLSDIHGNSIALEAVLNDIKKRNGVDGYWVLGDHCAVGYDPIGVLETLNNLPNMIAIKGNADRHVTSLDLPAPSIEDAMLDNNKIKTLVEVVGNFSWTRGALDATGWTDWMKNLPFEHSLQLPDGTQVLLIHSQPDSDTGKGLNPGLTDDEVADMLKEIDAGLICVGHFHMPMRRYFGDTQIVNPGSVNNSFNGDTRAYYAILEATNIDFEIKFYAVTYDLEEAATRARQTLNIGSEFMIRAMNGGILPSWKKVWDGKSHIPPIEPELE